MGFEGCEQPTDALGEAIVEYSFVFERLDLMPPSIAFLVDLSLLCADEGLFVDVGVNFDVAVVGQLEGVL